MLRDVGARRCLPLCRLATFVRRLEDPAQRVQRHGRALGVGDDDGPLASLLQPLEPFEDPRADRGGPDRALDKCEAVADGRGEWYPSTRILSGALPPFYSARNATIGSVRVARLAGT